MPQIVTTCTTICRSPPLGHPVEGGVLNDRVTVRSFTDLQPKGRFPLKLAIGHGVILWTLFFVICMSLGYPTLNRYDPRSIPGLFDSNGYYALVTGRGDLAGDESHRVLVGLQKVIATLGILFSSRS
jgi:hypothetical protein